MTRIVEKHSWYFRKSFIHRMSLDRVEKIRKAFRINFFQKLFYFLNLFEEFVISRVISLSECNQCHIRTKEAPSVSKQKDDLLFVHRTINSCFMDDFNEICFFHNFSLFYEYVSFLLRTEASAHYDRSIGWKHSY